MTIAFRLLTIALLMATSCSNFGQAVLEGRIRNHEKWSNIMYISVLNDFEGSFKLLDTIRLRDDGSFRWQGRVQDSAILYRILIPPKGGNSNSIVEGFADNYMYLVLSDGMYYRIKANADSLYYSSAMKGNPFVEEIATLKELKRPFYNLALNTFPQRKKYPDSIAVINKRLMESWKKEIDIYRNKLKTRLMDQQNAALTILNLYYYYQSNFGKYDSAFYQQALVKEGIDDFIIGKKLKERVKNDSYSRKGMVIPTITMKDIFGNQYSTNDWKEDGLYLVDLWASWCLPCRRANHTYLKDIHLALKDKGLNIVSISVDKDEREWREAVRGDRTKWPQLLDPQDLGVAAHFQIFAFPTYFIVNNKREILFEGNNELELKEFLQNHYKTKL